MHLTSALLFTLTTFTLSATASPHCHPGSTWPSYKDCHQFFECAAGGNPVLKTCGPGTAYSPKLGICDYEFKVKDCHHYQGPEPEYGHGRKDEDDHDGHGRGRGKRDVNGAEGSHSKHCHVGSAWPSQKDCHQFFECAAGGIPVLKTCGPGTAYSAKLGICDYEFRVESCKARHHHRRDEHEHGHGSGYGHGKGGKKNGDGKHGEKGKGGRH